MRRIDVREEILSRFAGLVVLSTIVGEDLVVSQVMPSGRQLTFHL